MTDPDPADSPNADGRKSRRRLPWVFGRAKRRSAAGDRTSDEGHAEILSRSKLSTVAAEMLALAVGTREAVACTFIEVRGSRKVNHAVRLDVVDADEETAAVALGSVFRRSDTLARWAENSFVVLSVGPGPESDDVERRMVKQLKVSVEPDSGTSAVSVSAGRVVHMPWQDEDLDQIVERADQEMLRQRRMRQARDGDQDFDEL